jgi:hypothetical protein
MVEPVRHRQTKEAGTDMFEPKATAPHLDSTATIDTDTPVANAWSFFFCSLYNHLCFDPAEDRAARTSAAAEDE